MALETIVERLAEPGWLCLENFLPEALGAELLREARGASAWRQAGVGLGAQTEADIRRDRSLWLDGGSAAQRDYLALMEDIRLAVNRAFCAGLFEYEAHFAHYGPGDFYRTHRDALRGSDARVLTSVCYLNPAWAPGQGGELLLYADDQRTALARLAPEAGRLLLFWSERFPHQVLPAQADRYSIAGWFRRNLQGHNPL